MPKIVKIKLISRHHNDSLASHVGIDKTRELIAQKYYWLTFCRNIEAYIRGCNICLASKAIRHKPYNNLQSLLVHTHWWKDLLIDFVTGLPVSTNWKDDTYNLILVIIDQLMKIIYYELVKITIDISGLAKIIVDVVIWYHGLPNSIVSDQSSVCISKFWSSLCYFFRIK